jgi:hypothetical protein
MICTGTDNCAGTIYDLKGELLNKKRLLCSTGRLRWHLFSREISISLGGKFE